MQGLPRADRGREHSRRSRDVPGRSRDEDTLISLRESEQTHMCATILTHTRTKMSRIRFDNTMVGNDTGQKGEVGMGWGQARGWVLIYQLG